MNIKFLCAILCLSSSIFAQHSEKYLYDFCNCDYSFSQKDGLYFLPVNPDKDSNTEVLFANGQVQLFRSLSDTIQIEYIRVGVDTFFYSKKNIRKAQYQEKGFVYFERDQIRTDTIKTYDPETYQESLVLQHYLKPIRVGEWSCSEGFTSFHGSYDNGAKIGTWTIYNDPDRSHKLQAYENGQLIDEKELNLIRGGDLAQIKSVLTDKEWLYLLTGEKLILKPTFNGARCIFKANGEVQFFHPHPTSSTNWSVSLKDHTMTLGEETFKILWLKEDYIELERFD